MLFVIQRPIQGDTHVDRVVGMLEVFIVPFDFELSLCLSVVKVKTQVCVLNVFSLR